MFTLVGQVPCKSDWLLVKDKNDIMIYSRLCDGTDIKEIRANTSINASMAYIAGLLMDVETFTQWMPNVKSTKILKRISEKEIYYYIEVKVPWPFTNRDNIMHIKLLEDAETEVVSVVIESDADFIPPKEGLVRIPRARGEWKLTTNEDGSTDVFLEYLANPGGKVPIWVVNFFITDVPFKTLTKLKEVAEAANCDKTDEVNMK
jgi:hypothetical protein